MGSAKGEGSCVSYSPATAAALQQQWGGARLPERKVGNLGRKRLENAQALNERHKELWLPQGVCND